MLRCEHLLSICCYLLHSILPRPLHHCIDIHLVDDLRASLSKLRHLNIVEMYGFCKKDNLLCLVTEYVRGGNLAECLENDAEYDLNMPLQIELALSISRGMVFLHNRHVIHRDLKPGNILVRFRFPLILSLYMFVCVCVCVCVCPIYY